MEAHQRYSEEYIDDLEKHLRRSREDDPVISKFMNATVSERQAMIARWQSRPVTTMFAACIEGPLNLIQILFDPENFPDCMVVCRPWHTDLVIPLFKLICKAHRNGIETQLHEEIFSEVVRRDLICWIENPDVIKAIMRTIYQEHECFLRAFLQHRHDDSTVETVIEFARAAEKEGTSSSKLSVIAEYCSDAMRQKHYSGAVAASN